MKTFHESVKEAVGLTIKQIQDMDMDELHEFIKTKESGNVNIVL